METDAHLPAEGVDLRPRYESSQDLPVRPPRRKWLSTAVLAIVVVALGFVLFQTLSDSALFFRNADEAIEARGELGESRFLLQGTPLADIAEVELDQGSRIDPAVVFAVEFEGAVVDVVHVGAPAELFQAGVPVVLEGRWQQGLPDGVDSVQGGADDGWYFSSSDMRVKHDNEYRNDYRERLDRAEAGATVDK